MANGTQDRAGVMTKPLPQILDEHEAKIEALIKKAAEDMAALTAKFEGELEALKAEALAAAEDSKRHADGAAKAAKLAADESVAVLEEKTGKTVGDLTARVGALETAGFTAGASLQAPSMALQRK
jgi:hypothetical protein